jgi:hypothetical protein
MAGFGQDKLFQLQFDPGKPARPAGGSGQIASKSFEELAGDSPGFGLQDLAESVVIGRFPQVIGGGCLGERGNRKDNRAENLLGFAPLGSGHAQVAGELQVDEGEGGWHKGIKKKVRLRLGGGGKGRKR